jgi:SAM-dependent methyltransferase/uncharacterized protein YbaR (Trm112 family)
VRGWENAAFDKQFEKVLPGPGASILEVGCGAAQWMVHFAKKFRLNVWGLDNSLRACQVGVRNLQLSGITGHIVCADLFEPPFRPGSFDVVYSGGVIEHFDDYTAPLHSIARLVAPGGLLITEVPNIAGWVGLVKRAFEPEVYSYHVPIPARSLLHAYEDLGLASISVTPAAGLRMPYIQAVDHQPGIRTLSLLALRTLDRALVTAYRAWGRGIDSEWLSSSIFAVGSVPGDATSRSTGHEERIVCPTCSGALEDGQDLLQCARCHRIYPMVAGIPVLLSRPDTAVADA